VAHSRRLASHAGDPTFTNAYGCTIVGANRFTIDRKLTRATVQPPVIPLTSFTCDEFGNCTETTEDVTVSASWTGTGEVIRFRDRSTFQQGNCKQTFRGRGEARGTVASITPDDETTQSDDAILVSSRTTIRISSACQ